LGKEIEGVVRAVEEAFVGGTIHEVIIGEGKGMELFIVFEELMYGFMQDFIEEAVEVDKKEGSGGVITSTIHWLLDVVVIVGGCQVGKVADAAKVGLEGQGRRQTHGSTWWQ
jgi:hypothetical protein